jgi:hypothetical protein
MSGSAVREALTSSIEGIEESALRNSIEKICSALSLALEKSTPDAWAVEINLGFKAGLKVPILMSGEANAALKVSMSWKKPI